MSDLSNINFLRLVLEKLSAEKPSALNQKGRTEHQRRESDLLKRLFLEAANDTGQTRVLVTGQIGVGKSSELEYFFRNRSIGGKTGFWIYSDLEKGEHPEHCGATGVLLTILRDSWGAIRGIKRNYNYVSTALQKRLQDIRKDILEAMIDWLKAEKSPNGAEVTFRFGGMDFLVQLGELDSALGLILGKAAQHEAVSDRSERIGLAPDRLISIMNHLFVWFSELHSGIPPLIILDHVDKIRDNSAAKEVLVELIPVWKKLAASIIMTAPYEYTLGEMRHSVESYWGKPLMVYPLDFPEIDATSIQPFYPKVCENARLKDSIDIASLQLLAHYSGGIPRSFIQFLIQACKEAYLTGHKNILMSDAQAVIFSAQMAYQDYGPTQIDLLEQISKNKVGLSSASVLLRSPIGLLVLSPELGHQPLKIHPLAEPVLQNYIRAKKAK
jgi:hypothetical protein